MMKFLSFCRQNLEILPPLPLPLYARSCGVWIQKQGKIQHTPGARSHFCSLSFCCAGTGRAWLYDREFILRPGEAFFYQSGEERHAVADTDGWTRKWLTFDGPLAMPLLMSYNYMRVNTFNQELLEANFQELSKIITNNSSWAIRRASNIVIELLSSLSLKEENTGTPGTLLEEVKRFISDNMSNPELDVNMICDYFHVHRSTLNRLFYEKTKWTPHSYIAEHRQTQAKALLLSSELTIRQIAEYCGFRDHTTFCRAFRNKNGISPSCYRFQALSEAKE